MRCIGIEQRYKGSELTARYQSRYRDNERLLASSNVPEVVESFANRAGMVVILR